MEESYQGLNEPLIGGNNNDDSTLAESSTTLLDDCNDADAAAGGGIKQSTKHNHPNQKKISGFVLAVIVFFNAWRVRVCVVLLCVCKPHVLTFVAIISLHLHKPLNAHLQWWPLRHRTCLKGCWKFICNYWY